MTAEINFQDGPWKWLESTRRLQILAYHDEDWPKQGEALADSVMMNGFAAMKEISEATDEVGWKPWAKPRGWVERDAFLDELVDAQHFIANMAVAVACTDAEWEQRYRAKQQINYERQVAGYDGRNKCVGCGRALDTPTTTCRKDSWCVDKGAWHAFDCGPLFGDKPHWHADHTSVVPIGINKRTTR